MKEIVFDILIAFVILGILFVAIGMFRRNLLLIDQSATSKSEHAQLQEIDGVNNSEYTGVEILTYLHSYTEDVRRDITVKFSPGTEFVVDGANWQAEIAAVEAYMLTVPATFDDEYMFDKISQTFIKK